MLTRLKWIPCLSFLKRDNMTEHNASAKQLILNETETEEQDQTVDDYKKLNEKCDVIISKIKTRKDKKKK